MQSNSIELNPWTRWQIPLVARAYGELCLADQSWFSRILYNMELSVIISFHFFYHRVIHLENGLTALLVSDTQSVTHRKHYDSDMSTTDDEDGCSEDFDDESDVDDDNNSDDGDDDIDGVMGEDPDMDQGNDCERSRKAKDTKLVSFLRQIDYFERTLK